MSKAWDISPELAARIDADWENIFGKPKPRETSVIDSADISHHLAVMRGQASSGRVFTMHGQRLDVTLESEATKAGHRLDTKGHCLACGLKAWELMALIEMRKPLACAYASAPTPETVVANAATGMSSPFLDHLDPIERAEWEAAIKDTGERMAREIKQQVLSKMREEKVEFKVPTSWTEDYASQWEQVFNAKPNLDLPLQMSNNLTSTSDLNEKSLTAALEQIRTAMDRNPLDNCMCPACQNRRARDAAPDGVHDFNGTVVVDDPWSREGFV